MLFTVPDKPPSGLSGHGTQFVNRFVSLHMLKMNTMTFISREVHDMSIKISIVHFSTVRLWAPTTHCLATLKCKVTTTSYSLEEQSSLWENRKARGNPARQTGSRLPDVFPIVLTTQPVVTAQDSHNLTEPLGSKRQVSACGGPIYRNVCSAMAAESGWPLLFQPTVVKCLTLTRSGAVEAHSAYDAKRRLLARGRQAYTTQPLLIPCGRKETLYPHLAHGN